MKKSTFNPEAQEKEISNKIVAGLERISEVFKILLWDKAKLIGLSPIQIQILIFIAFHKEGLCNVSHLAKEFNVTKPTISDAIRILEKKELIIKNFSPIDSRSYSITLSNLGIEIVSKTYDFSNPLKKHVNSFSEAEQESLFETLSQLIYKLNRNGILNVQRTCYGCKFYQKNQETHYCNLLQKELLKREIRLDCPEYEEKLSD
ncbi:MarR family transcriptional regulator [Flavobacteriaceae bacterium XHP0103]|uniref:MarR family winged helix-turn-helix transcriptional regulator n=1 Tax=Marixanthotalea marina TaxID=2844359 RepID=UPI002989D4BD|nr:MarR family transcriptional regulator [Marixanthotalea marina]MBU3821372.1 MarR family transcriptional regulator [Marixanthotalea marina]